jgi:hypothetical protein
MAVTNARKAVAGADNCVSCPACSYDILIQNGKKPKGEFSVICPNCGARKFHQLAEIHGQKQEGEAARRPARVKFGMKTANDGDRKVDGPEQPRSRMREFSSWLLK